MSDIDMRGDARPLTDAQLAEKLARDMAESAKRTAAIIDAEIIRSVYGRRGDE